MNEKGDKLSAKFVPSEKIVTLEQAMQLKARGFSEPTLYYWQDRDFSYSKSGLKRVKTNSRRMNHNIYNDFYSAPTKEEAEKWDLKQKGK